MNFETNDNLTLEQANKIIQFHKKEIGTEYELNNSASGIQTEYYVMFFDLELNECKKLSNFEKNMLSVNLKIEMAN